MKDNFKGNELRITFIDNDKEVGYIDVQEGKLCFVGKANKSAKAFFEDTLKSMVDDYIHREIINEVDRIDTILCKRYGYKKEAKNENI